MPGHVRVVQTRSRGTYEPAIHTRSWTLPARAAGTTIPAAFFNFQRREKEHFLSACRAQALHPFCYALFLLMLIDVRSSPTFLSTSPKPGHPFRQALPATSAVPLPTPSNTPFLRLPGASHKNPLCRHQRSPPHPLPPGPGSHSPQGGGRLSWHTARPGRDRILLLTRLWTMTVRPEMGRHTDWHQNKQMDRRDRNPQTPTHTRTHAKRKSIKLFYFTT